MCPTCGAAANREHAQRTGELLGTLAEKVCNGLEEAFNLRHFGDAFSHMPAFRAAELQLLRAPASSAPSGEQLEALYAKFDGSLLALASHVELRPLVAEWCAAADSFSDVSDSETPLITRFLARWTRSVKEASARLAAIRSQAARPAPATYETPSAAPRASSGGCALLIAALGAAVAALV